MLATLAACGSGAATEPTVPPASTDTTAPAVPTGVLAASSDPATVGVTWAASTDEAGGSGLKDYVVFRDGTQAGVATTASFTDGGRNAGTTYTYRIAARDNAGNSSAQSAAATATTLTAPDTVAPAVPAGVTATASTTTAIAVAWTASADSGGSGIKDYVVYRDGTQVAVVTTTTFADTGRTAGTTYLYRVAARDNAGNASAQSTAVTATTLTSADTVAPAVPAGLSASATSATTATITWNASTDTGGSGMKDYLVYRDGTQVAIVTATIFADIGRSAGATYSYQVSARDNANNESARATAVSVTMPAPAVVGLDTRPSNTSCVAPARPSSATGVTLQRVFPNITFTEPVGVLQAPGDSSRWFVLERGGIIKTFPNVAGVTPAQVSTFLNLSASGANRINDAGEIEAGLLGLAFHPDFGTNGKLYVFYSGPAVPNYRIGSRISEFTSANRTSVVASTERELIRAYKLESNHNGGQLAFGPDGYLYAGLGDGGGSDDPEGNGQNRNNLFAKMLRIDVNSGSPYAIPGTNPFAGNSACNVSYSPANPSAPRTTACPELYAYGLRNPWRFSFDRAGTAADLWVADVGQGGFEEIDRITTPGGNFGWNIREGTNCRGGGTSCATTSNGVPLLPPLKEYPHDDISTIIGGFVYRGSAMSGLIGQYIFSNFQPGTIYSLAADGSRQTLYASSILISSFGESTSGEIYAVDFGGGGIYVLTQSGGGSSTIPASLLATGCVNPANATQPAAGLIPFAPNAQFWSDNAAKDRWMALPNGTTVTIGSDGDWSFPNGTVLMKNFKLGAQLVETRLFMRHPDGEWAGYTYQWNVGQSDATRVQGGATVTYGAQSWIFPSEADCLQCHTNAAGRSLGLENGQQNGNFLYPQTGRTANQIATLAHIGVLPSTTPAPETLPVIPNPQDSAAGTVTQRARAWLHTNCAQCHRPSGGTPVNLDLRYTSTIAATNSCNVDPASGDLGVSGAKRLVAGDPSKSLVYLRLNRRGANQMPPIGTNLVDTAGASLIQTWIQQMGAGCN
ncbi:MAG: PQQ-dependent sugar dehydrogenase [Pseudomonadota bacterium]